jgi:hypothetical protein
MTDNATVWRFIHIIGKTYNPAIPGSADSFCCLFECLSVLLPDTTLRGVIASFISQYSPRGVTGCSDKAFAWTYKLRTFYNMVLRRRGFNTEMQPFEEFQNEYAFITKSDWGRPTWWIMHHIGANLPQRLSDDLATTFKAFVVCLSILLPCSECKSHMNVYIQNSEIDPYLQTGDTVFQWTWNFHNAVNKRLSKPLIEYTTALQMYRIQPSNYTVIEDL